GDVHGPRGVVAGDLDRDRIPVLDTAGKGASVLAEADAVAAVAHRHGRAAEGHAVDRPGDGDARAASELRGDLGRHDNAGHVADVGAEDGLEPVRAHPGDDYTSGSSSAVSPPKASAEASEAKASTVAPAATATAYSYSGAAS